MPKKKRKPLTRSKSPPKKPKSKPRPQYKKYSKKPPAKKPRTRKADQYRKKYAKKPSAKSRKVRRTKAQIAARLKRSNAAKKGHETRRLKKLIRERTYHVRDIEKDLGILEELRKPIEILKAPATKEEYEEHIQKLETRMDEWRDVVGPEWIRDDGGLARERSGLRLLPIEMRNKIRRRLDKAEENDNVAEVAYQISEEYEVPIKEVYTLWFS